MKILLRMLLGVVLLGGLAMRAEDFSKTLTPEEFAAAGLAKLTPEELGRLDALVQAQHRGEVAKVREETATKVREETTAKVRAEVAAEKPAEPSGGLLSRVRVMLTPGTQVDYAEVTTELKGSFSGYEKGTTLTLTNGQRWQVVDGTYWVPKKERDKPRKVVIQPGVLGRFFLLIEDGGRPSVKFVGHE